MQAMLLPLLHFLLLAVHNDWTYAYCESYRDGIWSRKEKLLKSLKISFKKMLPFVLILSLASAIRPDKAVICLSVSHAVFAIPSFLEDLMETSGNQFE